MRSIALAALLSACGSESPPAGDGVVDILDLGTASPAADRDLAKLIAVYRPRLSRCVDPFRQLVRSGDHGSVGVVLGAVGSRGRELEIQSVSITPRFGPAYDLCIASVLRGTKHVIASGDYALQIGLRLCIDPRGAP